MIYCDSVCLINFIHAPLATDDIYVDSRDSGYALSPLQTWDDVSFPPPDYNSPVAGKTSQSFLGFAYLTDPPPSWFDPTQRPIIAYLKMFIHNNMSWVGQNISILSTGLNGRNGPLTIGDSTGAVTFPVQDHFYPVQFRTYAQGVGYGVLGQQHLNFNVHHMPGVERFVGWRLQDIVHRSNTNPYGYNGQMGSDQSIATFRYDGSYPGAMLTDTDNQWQDASQGSAVDAHFYAGKFYEYLLTYYQRNSWNATGSSMISTVEDSTRTNNSSWMPSHQVSYGIAGTGRRSWAACPEVTGHEFSHSISHMLADREAGALCESFSNMMGVTFRYVLNNRPTPMDWTIGANSYTSGIPQFSMSDPHGDYSQVYSPRPDFYLDTRHWHSQSNPADSFGIHTNSGVPDKMFTLLSVGGTSPHNGVQVMGIGIENAMKVMYEVVAHRLPPADSTFLFSRRVFINAADSIPGGGRTWAVQMANAWNAVGVCDSCTYVPGDANNDGVANGMDAPYLSQYFMGQVPATVLCDLAYRFPYTDFFAPADCNGNCVANGIDVTYLVNYFKGLVPSIRWCPHFTPGAP